MRNSTARWTTAAAAAAFLALPLTAFAQTTPPATPPQQQIETKPAPDQTPAKDSKVDAAAAKQHLSEARDTLSQLTALPEAARLQGDARTQVSSLISNFNELITTQANWRASYSKLDANLTALLGPDAPDAAPPAAGVTGAVGTSGTAAPVQLDPAVRAKLAEFRTHLKAFETAAGSGTASGAMAPAAATDATANPANPTNPSTPTDPANPTNPATPASAAGAANPSNPPAAAGATGTSGVMPNSPTADKAPADQDKANEQMAHSDADKHLDAISAILNQSKTGALTKAQTTELKKHVEELRTLLKQSK
jgi:hypothetical protein